MNSKQSSSFRVKPGGFISGQLTVPGDKSISHRALMFGAIADGETTISGFLQGEDTLATAKVFQQMGVEIENDGDLVKVKGVGLHGLLRPNCQFFTTADFSSAAFFIVAASICSGSDVVLQNVGINPTRDAMLKIMQLMGADIELQNVREQSGEPVADIRVKSSELKGIDIPEELVPIAIDEFPVILVAAACANGTTRLTGAAELRVKESDRIQAMLDGFIATGIKAEGTDDGMIVEGGQFQRGVVDSHGDHRIAMSFAVAGMVAKEPIRINDCDNVATSFPGFVELAQKAGMDIYYV